MSDTETEKKWRSKKRDYEKRKKAELELDKQKKKEKKVAEQGKNASSDDIEEARDDSIKHYPSEETFREFSENMENFVQKEVEKSVREWKERWRQIEERDQSELKNIRKQLVKDDEELLKKLAERRHNKSSGMFSSSMTITQAYSNEIPLKQTFEAFTKSYDRFVSELNFLAGKIRALELEYEEATELHHKNALATEIVRFKAHYDKLSQTRTEINNRLCSERKTWRISELKQQLHVLCLKNQSSINENKDLQAEMNKTNLDLRAGRIRKMFHTLHETTDKIFAYESESNCFLGSIRKGWKPCSVPQIEKHIREIVALHKLLLHGKRWMEKVIIDLACEMKRISQCKLENEEIFEEFYKIHITLNDTRTIKEKIGQQKITTLESEIGRCEELLLKIFISDSEEKEKIILEDIQKSSQTECDSLFLERKNE